MTTPRFTLSRLDNLDFSSLWRYSSSVDKQKLEAIAEHISYEIEMFNNAADYVRLGKARNSFENNSYIEAFVVHGRCLTDFLYIDETNNDDVLAVHFFEDASPFLKSRPEITKLLKSLKARANKEVAHLTYRRLTVTPEIKPWQMEKIQEELDQVLKFFFDLLTAEQKSWFRVFV